MMRPSMRTLLRSLMWLTLAAAMARCAVAIERFPPPDFTDHQLPGTSAPDPRSAWLDYLDVAALLAGLSLATHFALVRRSRRALFLLSLGSLAWLGFWRKGCVCSIGSIQNVALALGDATYTVPLTVVAFFALPLVFTLFFGRTFCAAVCPLGAVQELTAIRPVRVPPWLDHTLGLVPFIYLGAAVLFAFTQSTFIICGYDPYVEIFRLPGNGRISSMLVVGFCLLVVGVFVGRPYCRYLCPYGAVLGLLSRVSKRHVRIPPDECIKCKLCEDSCPYGAIREPTVDQSAKERGHGRSRLVAILALAPILVAIGSGLGYGLAVPLAKLHPTTRVAEQVAEAAQEAADAGESGEETAAASMPVTAQLKRRNDTVEAFRNPGRPAEELYAEAVALRGRFASAGLWLGAWTGLVVGVKLVHLSIRRRRTEYEPDKAACVSCGRCFWYCPQEQVRLGLIPGTDSRGA